MISIKENYELLAPAGGMEALVSAVSGGADAVYLGGSFSARQGAKNFTDEELTQAISYCHLRGVKVYVAVNTLVSDREFEDVARHIAFINDNGADAIIVQDLGVFALAREVAPELSIHASTQMTVYDLNGAKLLEQLGFKRVVLARELSMEKIKEICEGTSLEVEVFVHGALCVSYSGQCLMSSIIGGRSGNRGRCAQPCRLLYTIEGKKGYLLSPKDMCLIHHIADLKKIGVKSFKIEGRMKGPDYVGTVASIYRKYMDSDDIVTADDYEKLERIFNRGGFTDAYFADNKGKDMFCHTKPDNPYKQQSGDVAFDDLSKKTSINLSCKIHFEKPIIIKASDKNGNEVEYTGKISSEKAINRPLAKERLIEQLSKVGGTVFLINNIEIDIDENISLPISEINDARRNVIFLLEQKILGSYSKGKAKEYHPEAIMENKKSNLSYAVQVSNEAQLDVFKNMDCDYLYIPLELAVKLKSFTDKEILILPRISPPNLEEMLEKLPIKRAMATNIGQIYLLKKLGFEIFCDHSLNVFNQKAMSQLEKIGVKQITLSTEMMLTQISSIFSNNPIEAIVYGRLPLMITENCIIKSSVGCKKGAIITDRTDTSFTVHCKEGCRNEILNTRPIVMSDKLNQIKQSGINVARLIFTIELPNECAKIYNSYKNGYMIDGEFTRGKFYKGV